MFIYLQKNTEFKSIHIIFDRPMKNILKYPQSNFPLWIIFRVNL